VRPIAHLTHGTPLPPAGSTVYLCIPKLSRVQWHAFTIAASRGTSFTLIVQVAGNWTSDLWELATARDGAMSASFPVLVEGPYQHDTAEKLHTVLSRGGAVMVVAGGSGIAALLPALDELISSCNAAGGDSSDTQGLHRLKIVWATRSAQVRACNNLHPTPAPCWRCATGRSWAMHSGISTGPDDG
jgi:hypothetical protein